MQDEEYMQWYEDQQRRIRELKGYLGPNRIINELKAPVIVPKSSELGETPDQLLNRAKERSLAGWELVQYRPEDQISQENLYDDATPFARSGDAFYCRFNGPKGDVEVVKPYGVFIITYTLEKLLKESPNENQTCVRCHRSLHNGPCRV